MALCFRRVRLAARREYSTWRGQASELHSNVSPLERINDDPTRFEVKTWPFL